MKTFLVTGAGRGIGLELTRQLLANNEHVLATVRKNSPALDSLRRDYPKQLQILSLEVGLDASVSKLAEQLAAIERIDTLINNAGTYEGQESTLINLDLNVVHAVFETNLFGPIRVTRAVLPWLKRAPTPVVANMTSLMGSVGDNHGGGYYAYRMSKAALNMFTKNLAHEFSQITSVVLHPGWVRTDMGGPQAPLDTQTSAAGLLNVISGLTRKDSGGFFDYRGKELPW
jgi:NAD(P)-dependent dehydrogenase (short-subunit alcohol dehydrogenase family)